MCVCVCVCASSQPESQARIVLDAVFCDLGNNICVSPFLSIFKFSINSSLRITLTIHSAHIKQAFAGSVGWLKLIAEEVVSLLQVILVSAQIF